MRNEIEKVLEAMREDYKRWSERCARHESSAHYSGIRNEMEENYCNGLRGVENRRYWKIIASNGGGSSTSVAGFIVKAGDKKFREGDMLKAAGWAAPARNFARGNVLDRTFCHVRWTGAG